MAAPPACAHDAARHAAAQPFATAAQPAAAAAAIILLLPAGARVDLGGELRRQYSARLNRKMVARTGGAAAVDGGNVLQAL